MKTSKHRSAHRTVLSLAVILHYLFLLPPGAAADTIQIKLTNGVTNPDFQTGTLHVITNPGAATEFDSIMRTCVTNGTTVLIHPGVYLTEGVYNGSWGQRGQAETNGFRLYTASALQGSGMTNSTKTTLLLSRLSPNTNNVVVASTDTPTNPMTNITVRDLEIDCNASLITSGVTNGYVAGVHLNGQRGMTISRVHVINAWGMGEECFILAITAYTNCVATNNTISECLVTDVVPLTNSYCSAISLNRSAGPCGYIEGLVISNIVRLNCVNGFNASEFAYNSLRTRNTTYCYNEGWWAKRGFNNDVTTQVQTTRKRCPG
jgi:hypothetical protein